MAAAARVAGEWVSIRIRTKCLTACAAGRVARDEVSGWATDAALRLRAKVARVAAWVAEAWARAGDAAWAAKAVAWVRARDVEWADRAWARAVKPQ
ncbi:hypothetical protein [Pseudodesulfovibrio cashew]|uniref:hypothetical protein n=1 Tax=Pseudodesulfovibrio cashew TaxID=2678688 RepID=UPI0018EEDAE0|nr:hypothetical protein [Pseudodesulfovibrio cashew]